jgi:hydroxypyruvate reductase
LARHDAYPLFDAVGGLLRTGPTGTNVADVRVILVR